VKGRKENGMNIIFDKAPHEPIILSHYRQRCERTGMVVDNRIERTPGGVPEVIEYIEMSVPGCPLRRTGDEQ
jgi:Ni,Fe-hydrogenase III small subunit